jgi:hypothetical protein
LCSTADIVGAAVHYGFYTAYQSVQRGVEAELLRLIARYPRRKVYVTGMATLLDGSAHS